MSGRGTFERIDDWTNRNRPLTLLGTVALTIALVALFNWLTGSDLFRQFFFPKVCDAKSPLGCDPLEWKELFQAAVLVLGLPIAFLLWHWRDRNVRDQIDVGRKDINLKEFQEVQLRAAGALDEELPEEAREQLQIAALHQLCGFLRGEYGGSFRRPAFELLLAGHAAAVHRIGLPEAQDAIQDTSGDESKDLTWDLREELSVIDHVRMQIIRDQSQYIFVNIFPLTERRFDFLNLRNIDFPNELDFSGSHFVCTDLAYTRFHRCKFEMSRFELATLSYTDFRSADMEVACFRYAELYGADFSDANLIGAVLEGANLECARFNWANLSLTSLSDEVSGA